VHCFSSIGRRTALIPKHPSEGHTWACRQDTLQSGQPSEARQWNRNRKPATMSRRPPAAILTSQTMTFPFHPPVKMKGRQRGRTKKGMDTRETKTCLRPREPLPRIKSSEFPHQRNGCRRFAHASTVARRPANGWRTSKTAPPFIKMALVSVNFSLQSVCPQSLGQANGSIDGTPQQRVEADSYSSRCCPDVSSCGRGRRSLTSFWGPRLRLQSSHGAR
jgi:hypothetical protein